MSPGLSKYLIADFRCCNLGFFQSVAEFSILPPLKSYSGKGDDCAKKFTTEFDARVGSRHRLTSHGERLFAEYVFPEAWSGEVHFG